MQIILYLTYFFLSGVASDTNLVLSGSSTSCADNVLCKWMPGDGYACKVAGGNQDIKTTDCEALAIHYRRWATEEITFNVIIQSLGRIIALCENRNACEVDRNATAQILEELDTLRGRLSAAAVLSVTQLLIVLVYLVVNGILLLVKRCKKHQAKQLEQEVELMENRLQERKTKRRAATAARSSPKAQ